MEQILRHIPDQKEHLVTDLTNQEADELRRERAALLDRVFKDRIGAARTSRNIKRSVDEELGTNMHSVTHKRTRSCEGDTHTLQAEKENIDKVPSNSVESPRKRSRTVVDSGATTIFESPCPEVSLTGPLPAKNKE